MKKHKHFHAPSIQSEPIHPAPTQPTNAHSTGHQSNSLKSPIPAAVPTGSLNIAIPKSLHAHLIDQAEEEGVSLEALIIYKLSR